MVKIKKLPRSGSAAVLHSLTFGAGAPRAVASVGAADPSAATTLLSPSAPNSKARAKPQAVESEAAEQRSKG
jgi:hypothetical protein